MEFSNPVILLPVALAAGLVPFLFLGMTSFVKISVVLSILRNAIGAGQIPSAAVSTLLSLALTMHIMTPVFSACFNELPPPEQLQAMTLAEVFVVAKTASSPIVDFLRKHSRIEERSFFSRVGSEGQDRNCSGIECLEQSETIFTLIPAFVISQLREAFIIGFAIFLPFLVIDLLVANILVGLGMMMVSPATIALPFKILLFVMCDAWILLCQSLVLQYTV